MTVSRSNSNLFPAIGDIVGLIGGLLILVGYAFFPIEQGNSRTALSYVTSSNTFIALTFTVGLTAFVAALINLAVKERAIRWYLLGLGGLALIYPIDNALRGGGAFALGGYLTLLGIVALVVQVGLPRPGYHIYDRRSETIFALIRMMVATLWFTQLLWKLPWDNFGCATGALTPAANTSGLCDWIGREIASPRYPAYKDFLTGVIAPNLSWMAFLIVGSEAFVCFSLMFGLLTRLGGLVGFAMGLNLFIGLTGVRGEWDWTYLMLPLINLVFAVVGGRFFGVDGLITARLPTTTEKDGMAVRLLRGLVS